MEGDKNNDNNNNKDNNNNNNNEEFDPDENKDQVNEINDINENEENMFINPEDIQEIEEIDKDALKEEMGEEMDIDENFNNDKENEDNNKDNKEEEENYHKEYENFKTKGEIYAINFHQETGTLIIGDGEDTTYFYNLDKKEIIREEKLNTDSVNFIKFSCDKKYMLTASVDGSINIFNVSKNFELIKKIKILK